MELRCIIVDDDEVCRTSLQKFCGKIEDLEVVATCKSAAQVIELLEEEWADFIFLDIEMPGIIPHGVRICAKRYKKRVSKVRFESTKNQTTCLPSTSAKPTLNVQNTKDFIIL